MENVVQVTFQNRTVRLYKNKSDITRKGNIKIMKHKEEGFFYMEHNRLYDVEGQFDILFDQGSWKNNFLQNSKTA